MSDRTYVGAARSRARPLVWLHGEVKSPPFSLQARIETGVLLRRLQRGEKLTMPHSRPLPVFGPRCHELRVRDSGHQWRVVYRIDSDAIVIAGVLDKKSPRTPTEFVESCRRRLRAFDDAVTGDATR